MSSRKLSEILSICVITRDECDRLSRLIDSAVLPGCELVVVDTGSVDDTLPMLEEKAREYEKQCSITVGHFTWINDFAAAKNYSASLAKTEFVMILDSDEWLTFSEACDIEAFSSRLSEAILSQPDKIGRIRRLNIIEINGEERINTEWINRIYSKELFEYRGTIHEQLVRKGAFDNESVYGDGDSEIGTYLTGIEIYHDGYLGSVEVKRKKAMRNIELLSAELDESDYFGKKERGETDDKYYKTEKQVPYILYQLGKSYYMAGDYESAALYLGEALFFDLDERLEYVIDLVEAYGYSLINSGRAADALALEGVFDAFGESADFRFLMGCIYMQNTRFSDAIKMFDLAREAKHSRMKGADSYLASYNAGVICEVLGDKEKARYYYGLSGDYEPAVKGLSRLTDTEKKPFLIIYGVRYCYNILNVILRGIEEALKKQGLEVLTYDEQERDIAGLSDFMGMSFQGIFAVQTYLYGVYLEKQGKFLFDEIYGPKYNIVLDHPGWLPHLFKKLPGEVFVLTHDRNYKAFIERNYHSVQGSFIFPMAAEESFDIKPFSERKYGLIFIGTYGDFREKCRQIREIKNPFIKRLANRYLLIMRKDNSLTAEAAFERALSYYGKTAEGEEFLNLFSAMNPVLSCVMYYYREKVIESILKAGIPMDIWGETWKRSKVYGNENLILHGDVTPDESRGIMEDAKLSLNIMAWHKDGFTERMAASMLSGAVLVTDRTTFFEESAPYAVQFELSRLREFTEKIKYLLSNDEEAERIAKDGLLYAKECHTWDVRMKDFYEQYSLS